MNETAGRIFSIVDENMPVAGCTVSKSVSNAGGELTAYGECMGEKTLQEGDIFVTPSREPVGISTQFSGVYTEITLQEDTKMNQILKAGEAFALKDLLPYQEGKIVNMDLINDPALKFVLMSFDAGTGLTEHAAPGEALIFALDGEAVIGYEGKEYRIKAGENFKFDKLGKHSVTADHKFKMALLLQLS